MFCVLHLFWFYFSFDLIVLIPCRGRSRKVQSVQQLLWALLNVASVQTPRKALNPWLLSYFDACPGAFISGKELSLISTVTQPATFASRNFLLLKEPS